MMTLSLFKIQLLSFVSCFYGLNHMSKYGSEKHILHLSITWQQNKIIQLGSKMKVLAKLAAASCYIIQEHQTCIPMANSCMAKTITIL